MIYSKSEIILFIYVIYKQSNYNTKSKKIMFYKIEYSQLYCTV